MSNNLLLGSTVYWNMTIADYCRFHDTWQQHQPYVRTALRPSRQQEDKVVVAFHLYDIHAVGIFVEAKVMLGIPAEEGTDIIINYNTNQS